MSSQAFNITLPKELVKKIDQSAKQKYTSRSEFIRSAVVEKLEEIENLDKIFERAHAKGRALGITSEQQVYDIIDEYRREQSDKR